MAAQLGALNTAVGELEEVRVALEGSHIQSVRIHVVSDPDELTEIERKYEISEDGRKLSLHIPVYQGGECPLYGVTSSEAKNEFEFIFNRAAAVAKLQVEE